MEKGKISSLQMAVMLYPAIIATSIISVPSIVAKYAKNDLWISAHFCVRYRICDRLYRI